MITPQTTERELRRMLVWTYLMQTHACIAPAALLWLGCYVWVSSEDALADAIGIITAIVFVMATAVNAYYAAGLFATEARLRLLLRQMIALHRDVQP